MHEKPFTSSPHGSTSQKEMVKATGDAIVEEQVNSYPVAAHGNIHDCIASIRPRPLQFVQANPQNRDQPPLEQRTGA
jgi:hypothetical protein